MVIKVTDREDVLEPNWTNITNNAGLTGTTINLGASAGSTSHYNYVVKNTLLKVPSTGEVILVTAVNTSTGAVTVTRNYGTSSTTSIDGSSTVVPVVIIGQAFPSGSSGTDLAPKATKQEDKYNLIQEFRVPSQVSKTLDASNLYGGPERVFQQRKKGIQLLREMEHMMLFGARYSDTTNGRRTSGGVSYWATSNNTDVGGSLTFSAIETHLRSVFRYGQDRKFIFTAPLVTSAFSAIAEGRGDVKLAPMATT